MSLPMKFAVSMCGLNSEKDEIYQTWSAQTELFLLFDQWSNVWA